MQFHIDTPLDVQEISDNLFIQGWVIHKKKRVERISLLSAEGNMLGSTRPSIHRPRVHELFKKFCNSESAGFELNVSGLVAGEYSLVAEADTKNQFTLATVTLQENLQPKLLFMHIAKTAGSSVNKYLASHYAEDRHSVHVESQENWRKDRDWARNMGFVSGHFGMPHFKRVLNPEGYYKITVVREPYAHLVSHLSWIRKLADQSELQRFGQHPLFVQHFAQKLKKTDLSKPEELVRLIASLEDQEKQLVDNCQVRYFTQVAVGQDVCANDVQSALETSTEFDQIGTTDRIDEFLKDVAARMGWKAPVKEVRVNVTRNYYGLDATDKGIRTALEPLVRFDLELYSFITASQERND